MGLLVDGAKFEEGILTELPVTLRRQSQLDNLSHLEGISARFDTISVSGDAEVVDEACDATAAAAILFLPDG